MQWGCPLLMPQRAAIQTRRKSVEHRLRMSPWENRVEWACGGGRDVGGDVHDVTDNGGSALSEFRRGQKLKNEQNPARNGRERGDLAKCWMVDGREGSEDGREVTENKHALNHHKPVCRRLSKCPKNCLEVDGGRHATFGKVAKVAWQIGPNIRDKIAVSILAHGPKSRRLSQSSSLFFVPLSHFSLSSVSWITSLRLGWCWHPRTPQAVRDAEPGVNPPTRLPIWIFNAVLRNATDADAGDGTGGDGLG
ncbi:hypothetical protein BDZ89DRAFT_1043521 [Hymenopellis radicata]|nr:hypothetical protein BDZ89DRAFT_1043521 [Hymenopellis radicata]